MKWSGALAGVMTAAAALGAPTGDAMPIVGDLPRGQMISASGSVEAVKAQVEAQGKLQVTRTARGPAGATGALPELALKDVPLWEALRKMQDAVGEREVLTWRMGSGTFQAEVKEPFSTAGAFLVRAGTMYHSADYGLDQTEEFYLYVLAFTDESTRFVWMQRASNPAKAEDDAGNSLVPVMGVRADLSLVAERGGGGRSVEGVRINLHRPEGAKKNGRVLKVLEGELPVAVATKVESVRMGLGATETRQYGDAEVTIRTTTMTTPQNMMEINVLVRRPGAESDEEWEKTSARFGSTRVRLLGPGDKQTTTQAGGESGSAQMRSVTVIYPLPTDGTKPEVVVELPAEVKEVRVPYRFRDLYLP
jgi:hypothetical protein